MKIVNLTPHSITFVNGDSTPIMSVPASGQLARVSSETVRTGAIEGIPTTSTHYGDVEGLPEQTPGTIYIVSSLVAARVPWRKDVFIPNESVRDNQGRIIGCKSLGHI